jgi:cell division protein FtsX
MASNMAEIILGATPLPVQVRPIEAYHAIQTYIQTHPGTVLTTYNDISTVVAICMCIAMAVGWCSAIAGRVIVARLKQNEYDRIMKQQED